MKGQIIGLFVVALVLVSCGKETTYVCLEPNPPVAQCCADDPTLEYCETPVEDMSGDLPVPQCEVECSGSTPFCDNQGECVACLTPSDCEGTCVDGACVGCTDSAQCLEGVCDTDLGACVACLDAADCPGDAVCFFEDSNADNRCVECLSNAECGTPQASRCGATNTCLACTGPTDCTHLDLAQCVNSACVECTTATEASDCGGNVCDPSTNTCTEEEIRGTLALNTCLYDNQCANGHTCVPLTYMDNPHGNYCVRIWTAGPCPSPYGQGIKSRTSVGGVTQEVCMISEAITTPEAIVEYGTTCTNDPNACVATGSTCQPFDMATSICTYPCTRDEDCRTNVSCGPVGNEFCGL